MNEKCNDRSTFQTNRMPTWIPDLIFKYQNTMCMLCKMYFGLHFYLRYYITRYSTLFLPGQARHLT
jgi:hypothetical protein